MTAAEIKLTNTVASMSTRQICEAFELTNGNNDSSIPVVRGALMNELEKRNPAAFAVWMESDVVADMDNPSKFFT